MGIDRKNVIPCTGSGPHLVVLEQIWVDEDAQLLLKPKGRHVADGLGNLGQMIGWLSLD